MNNELRWATLRELNSRFPDVLFQFLEGKPFRYWLAFRGKDEKDDFLYSEINRDKFRYEVNQILSDYLEEPILTNLVVVYDWLGEIDC